MPDVSVVITKRDQPGLLVEALDSVSGQTRSDWECIVLSIPDFGYVVLRHEGVRRDVSERTRLDGRKAFIRKHQDWCAENPRPHARQVARVAAEAYRIVDMQEARRHAAQSLRMGPSCLAFGVIWRASIHGVRPPSKSKVV